MDKLDLLVVIDPFRAATTAAMAAMPAMNERPTRTARSICCRRARSSRPRGSCTASNRSVQWREKVIEPLFESRTDHMIMYQLAEKFGFGAELVQELQDGARARGGMESRDRVHPREINRSVWTIGYTGQSPERLKAHMRTCTSST